MKTELKKERYKQSREQLRLLFREDKFNLDEIGRMAIIATVLKMNFPHFLFSGFYRVVSGKNLAIGPYQGEIIACGVIPFGKGVCGQAASEGRTIIVDDVSRFPGYIACDAETRSEIVVPVFQKGRLIAVFDVDSAEAGAFDETDGAWLSMLMEDCFA